MRAWKSLSLGLAFCAGMSPSAQAATVGPLVELNVGPSDTAQRHVRGIWDGERYLLVWQEKRRAEPDAEIVAARLDADGQLLDTNGLRILTTNPNGDQSLPVVAYASDTGRALITWIDPRSGLLDLYGARFDVASGTSVDPDGIAFSAGADAESVPFVACGDSVCMAGAQTIVNLTGQSLLRARAYSLETGFLDAGMTDLVTNPRSLRGPAATVRGDTVALVWEDTRNAAQGRLGADLYGGRFSLGAAFESQAGVAIVSANFRQSAPSIAATADGYFLSWQAQQDPTSSAGDDLNTARLDTDLVVSGTTAATIALPAHQRAPAAAFGDDRAMTVWSDFRTGGAAQLFGALIDDAGDSAPKDGFLVIPINGTVSEQHVIKGPNNDYLVVATRLTPEPTRAFYRIIRDEAPSGTLTQDGPATGPADGVTPLTLAFDQAVGTSGLPVVDGTLYTIETNRPITWLAPDADLERSGHQLAAVDGQVNVSLASTAAGPLQLSLESVEGDATATGNVLLTNVPAVAESVRITPPTPTSIESIEVNYTYFDVNSDPEGATQIRWTRNDAIQSSLNNQRVVPPNQLRRGDRWRVRVTPFDGMALGTAVFSEEVTVLNTPPRAYSVQITPADPRTGTALQGNYRFSDPDADPEDGTVLGWYLDGTRQEDLLTGSVGSDRVIKGQQWVFEVIANDGNRSGEATRSETATIANTPATADAGPLLEVIERRRATLDGSASYDIDPQDTLQFAWTQLGGPAVTLETAEGPHPSFVAPSIEGTTMLSFGLIVSDGEMPSMMAQAVVLVRPVPDPDGDGLDDEEEMRLGTDPALKDTDRDNLDDGEEHELGTDPLDADSDDDGIRDGAEGLPGADSDGDGAIDALDPDADDDGLYDGTENGQTEPIVGTDLEAGFFVPDSDPDSTTSVRNKDTDADGIEDGVEDANRNGRIDLGESDPNDATSTVGCSPEGACPEGFECRDNTCRAAEGSISCEPLEDEGVQCCTGGCAAGTPIDAICPDSGGREQCPAGSTQCLIDACQSPEPETDEGCGCSATETTPASPSLVLALMLGIVGLRRRQTPAPTAGS